MIDIHSHIIYDIDDGAESIEESVRLCRQAMENGFDGIVATPHFTDYRNIEGFVLERDSKLDLLRERLSEEQIDITLYSGAELFLSRGIFTAGDLDELTINNSRYMLCEFPLGPFNVEEGLQAITELTYRGYTPIVAHPERYYEIRRNFGIIERLLDRGVVFQVNVDSLAGNIDLEAQEIAVQLIKDGDARFIASDAHDIYRRNMDFSKKFSTVPPEISEEDLITCFQTSPDAVINDEDIFN
ncbi:MAG: hypothetical protein K2G60_01765 [Oscillospiraceae bacterium]|nr:hypothetical protein [Oscillospiraceae bacterium]